MLGLGNVWGLKVREKQESHKAEMTEPYLTRSFPITEHQNDTKSARPTEHLQIGKLESDELL